MSTILPISADDLLRGRSVESARVVFKASWNADTTGFQVLKTICAFANDHQNLNGGYVVIGVAESKGHARLAQETRDKQRRAWREVYRRLLVEALGLLERVIRMDASPTRHAWAWRDLARTLSWLRAPESDVLAAFENALRLLPDEPRFSEELERFRERQDRRSHRTAGGGRNGRRRRQEETARPPRLLDDTGREPSLRSQSDLLHQLSAHVLSVDHFLRHEEQALANALALPQRTDGSLLACFRLVGEERALVLDDEKASIVESCHEVRVEPTGRGGQPERGGIARHVANPVPKPRQAVDGLRAPELLTVLHAVEGWHAVGAQKVLSRFPATTASGVQPSTSTFSASCSSSLANW